MILEQVVTNRDPQLNKYTLIPCERGEASERVIVMCVLMQISEN